MPETATKILVCNAGSAVLNLAFSRRNTPTSPAMPELETAAEVENGKTAVKTPAENGVFSTGPTRSNDGSKLNQRYGCGPVELTGTPNALYERHLVFDNVLEAAASGARERFEAVAHSVRDVLSQRWIRTEKTYERRDPKRVYYLSMEFLIGRSLANNVTNLLLDDVTKKAGVTK